MSAKLNILRLRRGRFVGGGMIAVMGFLIFGFVFFANEPLVVQVTEGVDLQVCPPYCDEAYLEIPIPEEEVRVIEVTPIITTIDDQGNTVTTRGETTFLQQITGFSLTIQGDAGKTFDNGKLRIELELVTDLTTDQSISVLGTLESIESSEAGGNTATVPFSDGGITREGIFVAEILDIRFNDFVPRIEGVYHYDFVITNIVVDFDDIKFSNEAPFTIYTLDVGNVVFPDIGIPVPLPEPLPIIDPIFCDPEILNSTGVCAMPEPPLDDIQDVQPVCTTDCITLIIQEEIPPIPEEAIVEELVEDVPNIVCPSVEFDSISFLFPTNEISGTTALWDKTADGSDIIHADLRNNRNCDLTIAIDAKWRAVTGEEFITEVSGITILTNQTVPVSTQPFDGTVDCNGSCRGQEIQWCFIGQVSETDETEIVDEFCGKKFFR